MLFDDEQMLPRLCHFLQSQPGAFLGFADGGGGNEPRCEARKAESGGGVLGGWSPPARGPGGAL